MSDLELSKNQIVNQLKKLCAHCSTDRAHRCPVQTIARQVKSINGVPLIVNDEFIGVVWQRNYQL